MPETLKQQTGGKVPVTDCFAQAWRFLEQNWRLMLPAAGITATIAVVGATLVLMARPAGGEPMSMLEASVWDIALLAPGMIASLLFYAVVLRKAVRNEFVGRTGLTFGADEVRLLGVMAAFTCMILPFLGLIFLVLSMFVFSRLTATPEELNALMADPEALTLALEEALGPTGMLAFSLLILGGLFLFAYVSARLAMVNAATVGERRVVIFQTWPWSRGNVLRIFGAVVLTALPIVFFQTLLESVTIEVLLPIPQDGAGLLTRMAVTGVTTFLVTLASIPTIALGAILYKGLRPPDFLAK